MKKRIKIIIIIFSLLLIIGASSYSIWKNSFKLLWYNPFDNVVFKMAITSNVGYPTNYYILDKSYVLHYATGLCLNNWEYSSSKFLVSTDFTGKKKLNDQDAEDIMSLLNIIEENKPHIRASSSIGGYNLTLLYKDEVYRASISFGDELLISFSNKIRRITPLHLDYSTLH